MAGKISLPRAKSRAHTRMSSSVEIMLPDAQPQEGFHSVASTNVPSGSLKYPWACGEGNSAEAGNTVRFMPCGVRRFCSMKDASDCHGPGNQLEHAVFRRKHS